MRAVVLPDVPGPSLKAWVLVSNYADRGCQSRPQAYVSMIKLQSAEPSKPACCQTCMKLTDVLGADSQAGRAVGSQRKYQPPSLSSTAAAVLGEPNTLLLQAACLPGHMVTACACEEETVRAGRHQAAVCSQSSGMLQKEACGGLTALSARNRGCGTELGVLACAGLGCCAPPVHCQTCTARHHHKEDVDAAVSLHTAVVQNCSRLCLDPAGSAHEGL